MDQQLINWSNSFISYNGGESINEVSIKANKIVIKINETAMNIDEISIKIDDTAMTIDVTETKSMKYELALVDEPRLLRFPSARG